jgi:hypothetical protein
MISISFLVSILSSQINFYDDACSCIACVIAACRRVSTSFDRYAIIHLHGYPVERLSGASGDRLIAAFTPWITAQNAPDTQPHAAKKTVFS